MTQETEQRTRDDSQVVYDTNVVETVDARLMRITGAGNYVVYPLEKSRNLRDVKVGDPVKVIIPGKGRTDISLEAREEHVSTPIMSNWAIVVFSRESIELCRVYYAGVLLTGVDHMGAGRTELRLPRDGSVTFRIPDTVQIDDAAMVEVRDADTVLVSVPFGSIRGVRATPPPRT
jgi:hypothetical protein